MSFGPYRLDKTAKWVLRQIPGDVIRSVWSEVLPMLNETLKQCPNGDTWIPEDVYHEVKSGRAFLHVVGDPIFGCLVLQVLKDQYTGKPYLHVWIAYSQNLGAIINLLPEIERLARSVGADRITCHSPFEEFAAAGFEKKLMMFERRI
jgi:hypothetical protein